MPSALAASPSSLSPLWRILSIDHSFSSSRNSEILLAPKRKSFRSRLFVTFEWIFLNNAGKRYGMNVMFTIEAFGPFMHAGSDELFWLSLPHCNTRHGRILNFSPLLPFFKSAFDKWAGIQRACGQKERREKKESCCGWFFPFAGRPLISPLQDMHKRKEEGIRKCTSQAAPAVESTPMTYLKK